MSAQWKHGLFGCFDDCTLCIISYFVPCYQFGKNAEAVGESCLSCAIASMIPLLNIYAVITIRGKIRETRGIEGGVVGDLLTWCFCGLCALVQEAQECKEITGGMAIERE